LPAENQTVKPTFSINSDIDNTDGHLFVFISERSCAFAALNRNHIFTAINTYNFSKVVTDAQAEKTLQEIIDTDAVAQSQYSRTDVIYCTNQSIITPQQLFKKDEIAHTLNLLYGDAPMYELKYDLVLKHQMCVMYRLQSGIHKVITNKFSKALLWHQNSLLLQVQPDIHNLLYCYFNEGIISVMLRKENQLQIVQNFAYNTVDDAVYNILNVCRCYGVNAMETTITASGMIEETSKLHTDLKKYFSDIEFLQIPTMFEDSNAVQQYPSHYFSHFFALASCVL
jgi:hypothetical protein